MRIERIPIRLSYEIQTRAFFQLFYDYYDRNDTSGAEQASSEQVASGLRELMTQCTLHQDIVTILIALVQCVLFDCPQVCEANTFKCIETAGACLVQCQH